MGMLSLILLFCIIIFIRLEVEGRNSGPYTINLGQVENCYDMGTKEIEWTNITKQANGNYKAEFYHLKPVDRNFKVCVEGRELTKEGPTKVHQFNCKTCKQFWSIMGDTFSNFMVAISLKPEECNIPVGNFTATNWNASQPMKYIPKMSYNKFKFNTSYYINDIKVGCNIFNVEFVSDNK